MNYEITCMAILKAFLYRCAIPCFSATASPHRLTSNYDYIYNNIDI